ncbi:MAG: hypothetical protein U0165_04915 [Polyangiaceae bacterium]
MNPSFLTGEPDALDDEIEQEWARLHDQLDLEPGFWLGWLFSSTQHAAHIFYERCIGKLRAQGREVVRITPKTPEALSGLLPEVLEQAKRGSNDLIWVEALERDSFGATTTPWTSAWRNFLQRANEHREFFRKQHRGGLLFVAPTELKPITREESPDLWAFRAIVLETSARISLPLPDISELLPLALPADIPSESTDPSEDPEETIRRGHEALSKATTNAPIRQVVLAARALHRSDRSTEAATLLRRVLALPNDPVTPVAWRCRAYGLLAEIEEKHNDTSAAIAHYIQALQGKDALEAGETWVWSGRLSLLFAEQKNDRRCFEFARIALDCASEVSSASEGAVNALSISMYVYGVACQAVGHDSEAEAVLAQAISSLQLQQQKNLSSPDIGYF